VRRSPRQGSKDSKRKKFLPKKRALEELVGKKWSAQGAQGDKKLKARFLEDEYDGKIILKKSRLRKAAISGGNLNQCFPKSLGVGTGTQRLYQAASDMATQKNVVVLDPCAERGFHGQVWEGKENDRAVLG